MLARRLVAVSAALFAASCALTPDYERPAVEVPAEYQRDALAGETAANLPWWELFKDGQLQGLIRTALESNQDLAVALARIDEARSGVTMTRADQFPFIDILGGASRGRGSQQVSPGAVTRDNFDFSMGLSFEIDLWRKLSRATEASRAELLATEAAFRNVTITLVAEVANTYLALRDLDARLAIAERTVESRTDSLEIVEARFEKGTVAQLDVNQAQIELAIAEVAVATFQRGVAQAEHALRVLIGRPPGPIPRGLALAAQGLPPGVPAGLPSELLQRRPDVVASEEQLIAETARIGVAEALRYPSFSLTAAFGTASDTLSQLDFNEAKAWSLASAVMAPLFNSGKRKAQAKAQRARAEQAARTYEATLLRAFREVEDSLVAVQTYNVEYAARSRQVAAARNAARLSRARYDGGVVDYLEVLDSERSLFNAELDESRALSDASVALVTLYKALGGGWNPGPGPVIQP